MRPVTLEELMDLAAYERTRPDVRRRMIELKSRRRIQAGAKISIVFENRDTILYQIQEMVRAEKITEQARIEHELETYNAILPKDGCLAGTLFIEITEAENIRAELDAFIGLDRGDRVWFDLGALGRVVGRFAEGQSEEGRISSVHYLQFPFRPDAARAFCDVDHPVAFVIDHDGYTASVPVDGSVRRSLAEDLTGE